MNLVGKQLKAISCKNAALAHKGLISEAMLKLIIRICLDSQIHTIYITHSSNTQGKINEESISDKNPRLKFSVCLLAYRCVSVHRGHNKYIKVNTSVVLSYVTIVAWASNWLHHSNAKLWWRNKNKSLMKDSLISISPHERSGHSCVFVRSGSMFVLHRRWHQTLETKHTLIFYLFIPFYSNYAQLSLWPKKYTWM